MFFPPPFLLLSSSFPPLLQRVPDITLSHIGYQTDNGAYYVFCRGHCSEKLITVVDTLKEKGVPMGYLSFQGSGASSLSSLSSLSSDSSDSSDLSVEELGEGRVKDRAEDGVEDGVEGLGGDLGGNAPWCVDTWGVDGGLGGQYPVPLGPFQKALGVPLQLYAPYVSYVSYVSK